MSAESWDELVDNASFSRRHIGVSASDQAKMLARLGLEDIEQLLDQALPADIRTSATLRTGEPTPEHVALAQLRGFAERNELSTSLVGTGYHDTITPPVILRNVLENPAWYTAYTPYQPEISQGRLEALLNFQTMVTELTALDVANASMLDEGTAAAEAMTLCRRHNRGSASVFVVDADTHPQTLAVLRGRATPLDIEVRTVDFKKAPIDEVDLDGVCGLLIQYPGSTGRVMAAADVRALVERVHGAGALVVMAADPLALVLLTPPGELGADVAVGTTQRFGVPLGFGGPHAGYMAVRESLVRSLPGRLVGVSVDAAGRPALRLALQTREQHIRREKATSNICTAQVLLAVMAGLYAAYHGPDGLRHIALRVHRLASVTAAALRDAGLDLLHDTYFDTITVRLPNAAEVVARAASDGIDLRLVSDTEVGFSFNETSTEHTAMAVLRAFGADASALVASLDSGVGGVPDGSARTTPALSHPIFSTHHTEHSMLRYLRSLADKDLALDRTMIPLGSCTMKLNAVAEMIPVTWPEFASIHPFAPAHRTEGGVIWIEPLQHEPALLEIGPDILAEQRGADQQRQAPHGKGAPRVLLIGAAHHQPAGEQQHHTERRRQRVRPADRQRIGTSGEAEPPR